MMSSSTRLGINLGNFKNMGTISEPMIMLHNLHGRVKILTAIGSRYKKSTGDDSITKMVALALRPNRKNQNYP